MTARDLTVLIDALRAHVLRTGRAPDPRQMPATPHASHRLHDILDIVHRHPEQAHAIETLAQTAGLSTAHFCRIFKQSTGLTPHRYVMKVKLERAQQLLEHSIVSINQIADMLGFTSQSHFTRAFRGFTGLSPSEHRARSGTLMQ